MLIGVPKEIKDHEYRVGMTPAGVHNLTLAGHTVLVQSGAAARIGFTDEQYAAAGAKLAPSAAEAYGAELIVKVKEIQPEEWDYLGAGQVLFTFLHLAPDPQLTAKLLERGIVGIAYETVTDRHGRLPLLAPMSEIAGRLSIQVGATALQMANGGNGTLLAGVPGVAPGKVLILGGGSVGTNATRIAVGMGADVTLLDISQQRLRELDAVFGSRLKTGFSEPHTIAVLAREADVIVGAILIPGKLATKLLTRETIRSMKPGSVLVDVGIDQGGCSETSRPTSHSHPLYIEEGVVHYCVPNMPGAVARTSTLALTQVTLPYVLKLANLGARDALRRDAGFLEGLQVHSGRITYRNLAEDLKLPYTSADEALGK
jgi:alanine dehydrogenase